MAEEESALLPTLLVATTDSVYSVPFERPMIWQVIGPLVQVQVAPPGVAVAV